MVKFILIKSPDFLFVFLNWAPFCENQILHLDMMFFLRLHSFCGVVLLLIRIFLLCLSMILPLFESLPFLFFCATRFAAVVALQAQQSVWKFCTKINLNHNIYILDPFVPYYILEHLL